MEAQELLDRPFLEAELKYAALSMAKGKCPGPDGFLVEFYTTYWYLIGTDFTNMIQKSIQQGTLPPGVNRGLIALLHKGGDREELANWRPISLLNVAYKIMAKALQKRLQPFLSDVISTEQTAFLPSRYILDNVLIQHEIIQWAKESDQDMILLNLDFKKAYDTVHLPFLFQVMEALGIPPLFLRMVQTLFVNAEASVGVNGSESSSFPVLRGVRQGCPLAPYLFLFVGEALNIAAKTALDNDELRGIQLPGGSHEQLIIQYADDTHFTVAGTEESFQRLTLLITQFGQVSGLLPIGRNLWPIGFLHDQHLHGYNN